MTERALKKLKTYEPRKNKFQPGLFRFNLNGKYEVTIYIPNPQQFTYRQLLKQLKAQSIITNEENPLINGQELIINDKDGNRILQNSIDLSKNIVLQTQKTKKPFFRRPTSKVVIKRNSILQQQKNPQKNDKSKILLSSQQVLKPLRHQKIKNEHSEELLNKSQINHVSTSLKNRFDTLQLYKKGKTSTLNINNSFRIKSNTPHSFNDFSIDLKK